MIVLAQRHQIEYVAGLKIFRYACIRIQWSGKRMACLSCLIEYHQIALIIILRIGRIEYILFHGIKFKNVANHSRKKDTHIWHQHDWIREMR